MYDDWMNGRETRQYCGGISPQTLWRWRRRYGFPQPVKPSPKMTLYRKREIDEWMESRRKGAA